MQKIANITCISLIIINFIYVLTGILFHPLQSEDAIGIWLLKAKVFYFTNGFPNAFLHNPIYAYSHQQYPLGLPFIFSLIYHLIGGVKENILLLVYPILYLLILILVYKILSRVASNTYALLLTYIYSMFSPLIAAGGRILAGNADIFLVFIEWLIVFILYKRRTIIKDYVLITFLVMIASQIKLEGVFLSVILLFLPVTKKMKFSLFFISLMPFFIWMMIIYLLKIPSDTHQILPNLQEFVFRFIIIGESIIKELLNVNNWYLFWPLLVVLSFVKGKISIEIKSILLPSYLVMISLYILVYLFSSTDTYKYINSSFDRVLFQHSAIIFIYFVEKIKNIKLKTLSFLNVLDI